VLPKQYQQSERCFKVRSMEEGLKTFLSRWCLELPKPLVVFMDEVDALIGDGLISVLRQLRSGYSQRPKAFHHAMCLIGLRDIRDYRIYSDSSQRYIIGGSAFNIKEKSIRLENFTHHALQQVFELTQGQPWLVNALGRELCFDDYAISWNKTVTKEDVNNAAEILIKRRDVHLDQLADKLTEPRVERIIQSILIGEEIDNTNINEDQQYLIDLGLIRLGKQALEIANPIYREIIPR
jgi:hypothetical protein